MTGPAGIPVDYSAVAAGLSAHIEALAAELLPAGRRKGNYWTCGGVGGEGGGSLFVHLAGARRGRWSDAATGEFGDALDLLAACAFRGDRKAAHAEGLRWLGLGRDGRTGARTAPREPPLASGNDPAPSNRARALALWLEASASIADTPVEGYLRERGIDLKALGRVPRALRFHPELWHVGARMRLPAMVAAITDGTGAHVATHRTWLEYVGGGWTKARLIDGDGKPDNKKVLGSFPGGSIRLWRGASGKTLKDAPTGETVVIGEGIETCLSIVVACPEMRVLSAISLGNMGGVWLPDQLRTVVLAADNDTKLAARRALQLAVERHIDAGREVRVAHPQVGADFNDLLTGKIR